MHNRLVVTGVLSAGLLIAPAARAQTNGFVLQCLSARTSAMGCVTRAADAPTSLFRDPAGLVAFRRPTLEINVAPFLPSLTFQNGANASTVKGALHAYPMASFAYVGARLGPIAWGVGMEPIGGFGSDFRLQHELLSGAENTPLDYESFFAAAKFGPSLAFEIASGLSVGASVSGVYAQIRRFRMPFTMAPAIAQGLAAIPQLDPQVYGPLFQQFTELTAYGNSEGYSGLAWTADAGIAYRAPNGTAISASWSPRRAIDVDGGSAIIDLNAQFGQMLQAMVSARAQAYGETQQAAQSAVMQQLGAAGINLQAGVVGKYEAATTITLPMTAGIGISIPSGRLRLAGELEWRQWSKAEQTMPFRLSNGDNPNINLMLNGNPSAGDFVYPFPLEWRDAFSLKAGLSYELRTGSVLRGGFLYGENPVPDHTVFITFPAISTRAITMGTTVNVRGVPLDVSYVHAFEQEINGCAEGHKLGSEYLQSRTRMSENVFTIGTVLKF